MRNMYAFRNALDSAGNQIQAAMQAELLALREQQMHPQTNSECRCSGFHLFEKRFDQAEIRQISHRVAKGANARQNQLCRFAHIVWTRCDANVVTKPPQRVFDAPKIVQFVIDDCNHCRAFTTLPSWKECRRLL